MSRCLLRLEVFFFGPAGPPLFLAFAIKPPDFLIASEQLKHDYPGLIDNPDRSGLRTIVALFFVPLYPGADL